MRVYQKKIALDLADVYTSSLSKVILDCIWGLKDQGWEHKKSCKILERAQPFSPITGVFALCILEKWYILCKPELATINKRNEINNHCFHRVPCFWIRHDIPWDLDESQCSLSSLTCLVSCCKLSEDSGVHNTSDETICNRK